MLFDFKSFMQSENMFENMQEDAPEDKAFIELCYIMWEGLTYREKIILENDISSDEKIRAAIAKVPDINTLTTDGERVSVLHVATWASPRQVLCNGGKIKHFPPRKRVVELLLEHGANVNIHSKSSFIGSWRPGFTPLHTACVPLQNGGTRSSLRTFNGNDVDYKILLEYHQKLAETTSLLLQKGAQVDAVDFQKNTPLHTLAAETTDWSDWQEFLRVGIDTQIRCKLLLNFGANINAVNADGQTPLVVAVRHRNLDMIQYLCTSKHLEKMDFNIISNIGYRLNDSLSGLENITTLELAKKMTRRTHPHVSNEELDISKEIDSKVHVAKQYKEFLPFLNSLVIGLYKAGLPGELRQKVNSFLAIKPIKPYVKLIPPL